MAILAIEGFTGVPRASTNWSSVAGAMPLNSLNWTYNGRYRTTTDVVIGPSDGVASVVEADDTFATRNQHNVFRSATGSISMFEQMTLAVDTSGYTKFVLGCLVKMDSSDTTAGAVDTICLADTTQWTSSVATTQNANIFMRVSLPHDGSDGTITAPMASQSVTSSLAKISKWMHLELFIEQDVKRCRGYLEGTLVVDFTYNGTFASATGGFSIVAWRQTAAAGTMQFRFSNMYLLGCDDVHTGTIGPSTRVLEIAPTADKTVEWSRPAAFASNAAVLQQNFSDSNPSYLTTGDPATDLYGTPDAVAANAARIYGVAVKVQAMSMAAGTHNLAVASKSGTTSAVGTKNFAMTLGTLKPFVMDASKNPATGVAWTPAEITAGQLGFRLVN